MKNCWLFLGLATLPALANITYTCDTTSFSDPSNGAPSNLCAMLNGAEVSNVYSSLFNNVTANIYIQYGFTGVGESSTNLTAIPYSDYYNALLAHSSDPGALATLSSVDPLVSYGNTNGMIDVTPTLASALGIADPGAQTAGLETDGVTSCVLGVDANCYSGVITIAEGGGFYYPTSPSDEEAAYDFFAVVEHETDEILGTISCIGSQNPQTPTAAPYDQCNPGFTDASPADLFRYASPGVRSFLETANGSGAYFSNDGGNTDISDYNNSPNGDDYGDWLFNGVNYKVQDAEASFGYADISSDGGYEVDVLNAVGFNSVPEPATFGLLGASLSILAFVEMRRRRKNLPSNASI